MGFGLGLNIAGSRSLQAGPSPISRNETGIYREVKTGLSLLSISETASTRCMKVRIPFSLRGIKY
jgi:hypothetical protein